jgi:hypothetical protein
MPPKSKKGQDKGKSGEEERDEPLQAVVGCAMHLIANCADFVDTRGSLRDTLQPLHTRAPQSTHIPNLASCTLTLASVFYPSRIPRSSSTRSSFSPTPAWRRSLYTAAHTENRLRTISKLRDGPPSRHPSRDWSLSSRRHTPSVMRCETWIAGACSLATSSWSTAM